MGQGANPYTAWFRSIIPFGALAVLAGLVSGPLSAAEITIIRTLPPHNVLEQPVAPNATTVITAQTEQRDLITSLVPGEKMLSDGEFGAVLASPPPNGNAESGPDVLGLPLDGSRGEPLSSLPGSGMNSFSSLSGLGGQISGHVTGALGGAMQGLAGALNPNTGGSQ